MAGRPLKFKTAKEMQEAIDSYFAQHPGKPTMSDLAEYLGFVNRQSLYDYAKRPKYAFIKDAIGMRKKEDVVKTTIRIKHITPSQYNRDKYRLDKKYNLRLRMSSHMRHVLKKKKRAGVFRHLPYDVNTLVSHLERQFKPGMGWHNMSEWHIDHIIPVSHFSFSSVTDTEFLQCYALENLQPLWAHENIRKSNKLTETQIPLGV